MRVFVILTLLPMLALAQAQPQPAHTLTYQVSSGTGFVINDEGNVVTNNHVVKRCQSIAIITPRGEEQASLVARDAARDLAVLRTRYIPQRYASLRWDIDTLEVGDEVTVAGFPNQASGEGHLQYKSTNIYSLRSPSGERNWIQLTSLAEHGNSGGPVLDQSGNVIAVMSGNVYSYHVDRNGKPVGDMVSKTGVAITLPALRDFLSARGITFNEAESSNAGRGEATLRDDASHYVVPVRCVLSVKKN